MVRYIKLIYSWSVHPARRRRTHSITVTVRSAHSMASSSTSESDSVPVSSACKAQRWYERQSRRLDNEGENFFPRFARTDRRYAPLCTSKSIYKIASYGPAQYRHPPFNIPRFAPAACRPTLPLTQQSRIMLHNFPPGCPPLQKKLCTALLERLVQKCPWTTTKISIEPD